MRSRYDRFTALALGALMGGLATAAPVVQADDQGDRGHTTATPIKHVIYIIGENRTFDNLFATFKPRPGQKVLNLLSQGIVNADGTPGPNFSRAQQWIASDTGSYSLHPGKVAPFGPLGPITVSGTPNTPYFPSVAVSRPCGASA